MGEALEVLDVGGDVAEHAHVVSVVHDAADVGDQVLVEGVLALEDGDADILLRDGHGNWHPRAVDDVFRGFHPFYGFSGCLDAVEFLHQVISVIICFERSRK